MKSILSLSIRQGKRAMKEPQRVFCVTVEYITTVTVNVEAVSEEEAKELALSGEEDGDLETDFSSGEIISVEEMEPYEWTEE